METEATFASVYNAHVCPEDIRRSPELSTGLAYNNFDRFVDTTSGKDTLHDTVGIIFQNVVEDSSEEITEISSSQLAATENQTGSSESRKKRLRSMDAVTHELETYNKRQRYAEKLEEYDSPLRLSENSILLQYKKIDFFSLF